jgi:type VI secretion system protein VasJ
MVMNFDIEMLLKPINEASPSGEEAKYEFCYELMEFEIKKFGSLFGETVDWKIVEANATEVLSTYSKDLKAICYLTRALIEREGFDGFETGLSLLLQSLTTFSDGLYPRRKRARDGSIEWFISQIESVLPKLNTAAVSWEQGSACLTLISDIDDKYKDAFSDSDVEFFVVRSAVNAIMDRLPKTGEGAITPVVQKQADVIETVIEQAPKTMIPRFFKP